MTMMHSTPIIRESMAFSDDETTEKCHYIPSEYP